MTLLVRTGFLNSGPQVPLSPACNLLVILKTLTAWFRSVWSGLERISTGPQGPEWRNPDLGASLSLNCSDVRHRWSSWLNRWMIVVWWWWCWARGQDSPAAPEAPADYRTGTRTHSVFIRERSKIIQESSGPLIHLKRQMRAGGRGGAMGYFERGEPWGTAMRVSVNKYPNHLNPNFFFSRICSQFSYNLP